MGTTRKTALAALLAAALAAGAAGAAQADDWEPQLARQMLAEYGCELDFYVMVEESWRNGQRVIRTRLHCFDQRLFDAERIGDTGAFEVRPCGREGADSC